MRSLLLGLWVTTVLSGLANADPLRDMAAGMFGALPTSVPEVNGDPVTPEKAALGKALFFDTRLSANGTQSCNSCHDLGNSGVDGQPVSVGQDGTLGIRNTSTVLNAVLNGSHFWDNRDEDMAAQAGGPVKAGLALLNTPEGIVAAITAIPGYAPLFAAAFPEDATPNPDSAARALAAFTATLIAPAPLDAWLAGDDAALTAEAKAGLQLFNDKGCSFCHFGPTLGGSGYYPLGLVEKPPEDVQSEDEAALYAANAAEPDLNFRTAPLRNVAVTSPYFHSGKVSDLGVAVNIMAESQLGSPLSNEETAQLVAFLESLTGTLADTTPPVLP
jgi:cytochrome c peroxidase